MMILDTFDDIFFGHHTFHQDFYTLPRRRWRRDGLGKGLGDIDPQGSDDRDNNHTRFIPGNTTYGMLISYDSFPFEGISEFRGRFGHPEQFFFAIVAQES